MKYLFERLWLLFRLSVNVFNAIISFLMLWNHCFCRCNFHHNQTVSEIYHFKIELPASVRSELEMNIHIMVSQLIVGGEALATVVTPEVHCIMIVRKAKIHLKNKYFCEKILTPSSYLNLISLSSLCIVSKCSFILDTSFPQKSQAVLGLWIVIWPENKIDIINT